MSDSTRRTKLWFIAATLFTFVNILGAGFAVGLGEGLHSAVHVGLAALGAYVALRLGVRARARQQEQLPAAQQVDVRLEQLQQSVDAIALEVERIGEAQRFSAKIAAERAESSPPKRQP